MRHPRRILLALPLILGAGCTAFDRDAAERAASPSARFGVALEAADPAVDAGIALMDGFERRAAREERAVSFALGRSAAALVPPVPGPGAAEAAGEVLAPAFTALGDYAHVLAQAATGTTVEARPSPGGPVLAQAVDQALSRNGLPIAPALREAGLAGVAALAGMAPVAEARRRPGAAAMAREAEPHLAAVSALLKAVIGPQQGQATRGAIRARREAMEAAHTRLLEASRRDPALGAAGRYALFHQVAALRDQDPLPGTLASIVALLTAMEEAHAAIAAGGAVAEAKVTTFEGALARLSALTGQDQAAE